MDPRYPSNPFPPPPRRILAPVLLTLMFLAALGAGIYLVVELVQGEPPAIAPSAPAPDALVQSQLATLERQLGVFEKTLGRYPTPAEGLDALVERPASVPRDVLWFKLRDSVPPDPWGRAYQYTEVPGNPPSYRLASQGPKADDPADDIVLQLVPPPAPPPAFRATR